MLLLRKYHCPHASPAIGLWSSTGGRTLCKSTVRWKGVALFTCACSVLLFASMKTLKLTPPATISTEAVVMFSVWLKPAVVCPLKGEGDTKNESMPSLRRDVSLAIASCLLTKQDTDSPGTWNHDEFFG